uniref:C-type lectin domain-containing protein n=1 Tax=Astyanax mexicanus TaxID=7994 RepID=A0A3B1K1V6_ASTMX
GMVYILTPTALWTLSFCGTRQFHVVKEAKNWTEAQKYCRENFTDLATIENQEELDAVKSALKGATGHFWIGLRQNPEQKTNRVSSCVDLLFKRKLNQSGAVQSGSKQWISLLETQTLNFICTESDGETRTSCQCWE